MHYFLIEYFMIVQTNSLKLNVLVGMILPLTPCIKHLLHVLWNICTAIEIFLTLCHYSFIAARLGVEVQAQVAPL